MLSFCSLIFLPTRSSGCPAGRDHEYMVPEIEPEVVENMRSWAHSGFSVDQSVLLPAGDGTGIERLMQYMIRCPFSLSRLVKVTETGQVVYKAEKDACRAFADPQGDGLTTGPKRNFQILGAPGTPGRWISWPSSSSTFRPRARISSATTAGSPTRPAECAARPRKPRPRRNRKRVISPRPYSGEGQGVRALSAARARLGPCSSSGSTRLTRCSVLNVAARWSSSPSSNRRRPT